MNSVNDNTAATGDLTSSGTPASARPKQDRKLTPQQKADRYLTSTGWGLLFTAGGLFYWWGNLLPVALLPFTFGLILLGVNLVRLVRGFRVHWLSSALGIVGLMETYSDLGGTWDFPLGYVALGAVVLYLSLKVFLGERIR